MQKLAITLLGLATLVLAFVCAAQWRQLHRTQQRLHATEEVQRAESAAREAQATKFADIERANARLDQQVREFTAVTTALRTKDAQGCDPDGAVRLRALADGNHEWPGGADRSFIAGSPSDALDATDDALDFFLAHPATS